MQIASKAGHEKSVLLAKRFTKIRADDTSKQISWMCSKNCAVRWIGKYMYVEGQRAEKSASDNNSECVAR